MKAIVLGGGGILALSLLVSLKDEKDFSEVLVTDLREDVVGERVAWLNDKKFTARALDATGYDGLVSAMNGYDIVLSTARTRGLKQIATKAALQVGAHYIDAGVGGEDLQLALDGEFKEKGLTAILDMYYSPGLHDMLAAYAIERLDTTERVDFKWAVVDIVPSAEHSRPLYWGFTFEGFVDHFLMVSNRWENGKMLEFPRRHEPEMFAFKGPVGTALTAGLRGDSMHNLSRLRPDIPIMTFKQALINEDKYNFILDFGLAEKEAIEVDGQMVSARAVMTALAHNQPVETKRAPDIRHGGCVIVKGERDGQKVEYRIDVWPSEELVQKYKDMGCAKYGGPGGVFRCGSPMASVAVMIAQGKVKEKGVFFPAFKVPPDEFLKQEARSGLSVEITKNVTL